MDLCIHLQVRLIFGKTVFENMQKGYRSSLSFLNAKKSLQELILKKIDTLMKMIKKH